MDFLKNLFTAKTTYNNTPSYTGPSLTGASIGPTSSATVPYNSLSGVSSRIANNIQASNTPVTPTGAIPVANAQTTSAPVLPSGPGSPQAAAAQQQSDMQKYFPSVPPPTALTPKPFTINPGPTINSSSANPSTTVNDALNTANSLRQSLFNGSAPANYAPSDNLYQTVLGQIYKQSQYTPEEQAALQNYGQTSSQILQAQLAQRRQVQQLQEDGGITKEQGAAFITEANRRANQDLANLATQQSASTLSLQTLGMLRQNQLGALQSVAGALKPTEVAPGSTLVNPVTGEPTYQGNGAAPATVMQTAQQLAQMAMSSGTMQYNSDGTPNLQPYLEQAQQYYQTHQIVGGGSGTQVGQGTTGTQQAGGIPPQLGTYLQASGGEYVNEDKVPTNQRDTMKMLAAQNGIPFLTTGDVQSIQAIDYTKYNLQQLNSVVQQVLAPGLGGRITNPIKGLVNNLLQNDPRLVAFNQARETAIKQIQSLVAGSGSGFRLTQPEIEQAVSQLPTQNDSLEYANAKLAWINSFLDTKKQLGLTGKITPQGGSSSSNVIQTKVGAVDNSWFQ
jgi:hypothetical protein